MRLLKVLVLALAVLAVATSARAACTGPVAALPLMKASYRPAALAPGVVSLTFLGHASFLIETPEGVAAVTDYNGYNRPPFTPDIVTMNVAHSSHYTDIIEPGIKLVLRGWDPGGGVARHDVTFKDVRVRNIPTNIRDFGERTRMAGNSIFIFDIAGICIVHLGHLHHTLTPTHLADLGKVDVLLVPVDGTWTMSHEDMAQTLRDIRPSLVIPMHYFGRHVLETFVARVRGDWPVKESRVATVTVSRDTLPESPEILILAGY